MTGVRVLAPDSSGVLRADVAIVGGGFSAVAVATHLACRAVGPLLIAIVEPRATLGRGLAYGVPSEHLLLNVRASGLTIDPARPGDFLRWCGSVGRACEAGSFVPRAWFGEYAEARLEEAIAASAGRVRLGWVRSRASDVRVLDGAVEIGTLAGERVLARQGVIAQGNGPARVPGALRALGAGASACVSPWDAARMCEVARSGGRVLVVGTGLTMCDAVMTLVRDGFAGTMLAISRRGLLPQPHAAASAEPHAAWAASLAGAPLGVLRREIVRRGRVHDWRSVIDALRPHNARLWSSLTGGERRRFFERLAPYWDVHRHRCPPETAEVLEQLRASGTLLVRRGEIVCAAARGDARRGVRCEIRLHGEPRSLADTFDAVVVCTGPEPDMSRWGDPCVDAMLHAGVARPDALRLGLETTPEGWLVGSGGEVSSLLSTIGPPRRGMLWESTAAPEIAPQAASLAQEIVNKICKDSEGSGGRDRCASWPARSSSANASRL